MFSVWDGFWLLLAAFFWVAPWHVPAFRHMRLMWNDRISMSISIGALVLEVAYLILRLFQHDYSQAVNDAAYGSMIGYSLWRAWREHKPPRRRLRDRISALGKKLSERITITPVRVPLPVGA